MPKRKRGGNARATSTANNSAYDDVPNSKLVINNYMDVADEDDAFHSNRDKILLEDAPEMKRWRGAKGDDMIELSDEEVLAGQSSESDEDQEEYDEDEEIDDADLGDLGDEQGSGEDELDEDDPSGWGTSKADYYGADEAQTEEEFLREEEAAREAQQKRLKGLKDADYGFDEDEWTTGGDTVSVNDSKNQGVISEELPEIQLRDDMSAEEKLELLNTRYPEFELLSQELLDGQALFKELGPALEKDASLQNRTAALKIIKAQALSSYLGSLVMYFAILTSPAAEDKAGKVLPLAPHELREHPVMDTIFRCRQNWINVKDLDSLKELRELDSYDEKDDVLPVLENLKAMKPAATAAKQVDSKSKKAKKRKTTAEETQLDPRFAAAEARRTARMKQTEESLAKLTRSINASPQPTTSVRNGSVTNKQSAIDAAEYDSDLGDEAPLDPKEAAEKARKRKSLRFYTSQIQQKANKRANASRAAGGDDDIPHRERLRDRQERLLKEAEKRGQKKGRAGEDLDGASDNDIEETNLQREQRLEQDSTDAAAQALEDSVQAKKVAKRKREEAYQQAKAEGGKVVQFDEGSIGKDGRREIGYTIEKNKGLTPKRNKDVKNPRVKKRKRYEDKSKKLRSMKPVWKGGEGKGGYGGELTGIKTGLVKSVKL